MNLKWFGKPLETFRKFEKDICLLITNIDYLKDKAQQIRPDKVNRTLPIMCRLSAAFPL